MSGSKQLHRSTNKSHDVKSEPQTSSAAPRRNRSEDRSGSERVLTVGSDETDADEFLALLDDDYAQRIFEVLSEEPRPARELADACDASRATVYRRLNRLEEHDLVHVEQELHPDGYHRKVFRSTFERATIELVDGSPQVRLVVAASDRDGGNSPTGPLLAE